MWVVCISLQNFFFRRSFDTELFNSSTIIQWQYEVLIGLIKPGCDHLLQLLRILFGKIFRLGTINRYVIKLPLVLVEVSFAG